MTHNAFQNLLDGFSSVSIIVLDGDLQAYGVSDNNLTDITASLDDEARNRARELLEPTRIDNLDIASQRLEISDDEMYAYSTYWSDLDFISNELLEEEFSSLFPADDVKLIDYLRIVNDLQFVTFETKQPNQYVQDNQQIDDEDGYYILDSDKHELQVDDQIIEYWDFVAEKLYDYLRDNDIGVESAEITLINIHRRNYSKSEQLNSKASFRYFNPDV